MKRKYGSWHNPTAGNQFGTRRLRHPHDISEGDTWEIDDLDLEFEGCCNLTIYEQDLDLDINLTDFQGCVRFLAGGDDSADKVATNGSDSGDSGYSKYSVGFTNLSSNTCYRSMVL